MLHTDRAHLSGIFLKPIPSLTDNLNLPKFIGTFFSTWADQTSVQWVVNATIFAIPPIFRVGWVALAMLEDPEKGEMVKQVVVKDTPILLYNTCAQGALLLFFVHRLHTVSHCALFRARIDRWVLNKWKKPDSSP